MAENLGTASLDIEGDTTQLKKDLAAAKGLAEGGGKTTGQKFGAAMGAGVKKAAIPAAAALALVAVGAKKTIDSAKDLAEAQSAVNTTFGDSAGIINEFASSTEDSFSKVDFLGAAKTFAVFGKAAGKTDEDLAHFSSRLVFAAQDMASFHNADPSEVLENVRAGLAGETEPLRKYGILMNEAALNEFAWKNGIAKRGKELTEKQKVLARQGFILENLGDAENDYARTADSAANADKRNAANKEDMQARIGKGLIPAYQVLQGIIAAVTGFMADHTNVVKIATGVVLALASAILVARGAMILYNLVQKIALIFTSATNAALIAQRVLLALTLVGAILLVAGALIMLWKKSATFRRIVTAALDGVKAAGLAMADFFTKKLPAAFNKVLNWVKRNWPKIAVFLAGPFAPLVLLATDAFGIRSKLIGALTRLLSGAKSKAKAIGTGIKNALIGGVKGLAGLLSALVRGAINGIIGRWNALRIPGFKIDMPGPIPDLSFGGVNIPDIPYLHSGGMVPGVPGTDVLAILEAGEEVIPRGGRGRQRVTVNQYFTEPPVDPFPWLRKSQFAAAAVYDG